MATITEIISRIDSKIYDLINDTNNITSYSIGGKRVDKAGALRELRELRKTYQEMDENTPVEIIQHVALDFGEFGTDESEYIGDSN